MYKILTSVVLSGVLLAGCADTDGEVEGGVGEAVEVEAVDEVEDSVFVDDIQTSFTFTPTKAPNLTEEEKRIGRDLSLYVSEKSTVVPEEEPSEIPSNLSDREYMEMASEEYPYFKELFLHKFSATFFKSRSVPNSPLTFPK